MKKIKTIFLTVLFFGYFVVAKNSLAATHYVRNGASGAGNGENWTDAWTSLPAVLVRGDTYYIADGSYSDYTFDDAASGNSVVVIQKATTSQHGTDSGWQASYGDGTAVFTGTISVNADYLLFDGVSGGGPGSWTSGYGFEFTSPAGTSINYFHIADAVSNITLRHIYFNQIGDTEIYTTGAAAIYNATMVLN